jgi:hypothetical protein
MTPIYTPGVSDVAAPKASSMGSVNEDIRALDNKVLSSATSVLLRVIPSSPGAGRVEIFLGSYRFKDLGSFNFPAGISAVRWDLTDEQGNRAPSGRYTAYFTDSDGVAHRTYLLVIH